MSRFPSTLVVCFITAGLSACITAGDRRADLRKGFHDQVRRCYILPRKAAGEEPAILEVRLRPDGTLEQTPKVLRGSPDSAVVKAALGALNRCTPFRISPGMAERYADWKVMRIQFDTD